MIIPIFTDLLNFLLLRNKVWRLRDFEYNHWTEELAYRYQHDGVMMIYKSMNLWRELDRFSQFELRHIIEDKDLSLARRIALVVYGRYTLCQESTNKLRGQPRSRIGRVHPGTAIQEPWKGLACEEQLNLANIAWTGLLTFEDRFTHRLYETDNAVDGMEIILDTCPWLGDFRAYEVATSISYFPEFYERWNEDQIVHVGKGSAPAIDWLSVVGWEGMSYEGRLKELHALVIDHLSLWPEDKFEWIDPADQAGQRYPKKWCIRQTEDLLCEFRKYWRISQNVPEQRRRKREKYLD